MISQQLNLFQETQISSLPTPNPAPFRGTLIYEPKGRAREYAALACNVYAGCDHRCTYCYAPSVVRKSEQQFAVSATRGPHFLRKLKREAARHATNGYSGRVLLSFTCDPYQHLDVIKGITRRAIQILHRYNFNVEILTKGGSRALRDLDLFTPEDAFATTLTLLNECESLEWEPDAAPPDDRIETTCQFHNAGIPTWVSLEPVLDPSASLQIIKETHSIVDVFKVGTLNYHRRAHEINWRRFANDSMSLLKSLGYHHNHDSDSLNPGDFYMKRDLAQHLSNAK